MTQHIQYHHILLAADFSEHSEYVTRKAHALASLYNAKLSIIHIIDDLPITDAAYGPIIPFDIDLNDQLMEAAKKRLNKMGMQLHVPEDQQFLEMGNAKLEIVNIAKTNHVDLIVVGSHGRHGLALLLGSTANGVLHHAKCDVLAVRLQES